MKSLLNKGGSGVFQGVMVRGEDNYVIALRNKNNEIDYLHDDHKGMESGLISKVPLLRGVFSFIENVFLGLKTLISSIDFYEEDRREKPKGLEKTFVAIFGSKGDELYMAVVTIVAILISFLIFMFAPYKFGDILARDRFQSGSDRLMVEFVIRVALVFVFFIIISFKKEIRMCAKYSGAHNKVFNCLSKGQAPTVENAMMNSRYSTSYGNNFILYVLLVSALLFAFVRTDDIWVLLGVRLAIIPASAAILFEIVRLNKQNANIIIKVLNIPAMVLQRFMVKEPTEDMLEVAVAAVEAAFDWRTYFEENGINADNMGYSSYANEVDYEEDNYGHNRMGYLAIGMNDDSDSFNNNFNRNTGYLPDLSNTGYIPNMNDNIYDPDMPNDNFADDMGYNTGYIPNMNNMFDSDIHNTGYIPNMNNMFDSDIHNTGYIPNLNNGFNDDYNNYNDFNDDYNDFSNTGYMPNMNNSGYNSNYGNNGYSQNGYNNYMNDYEDDDSYNYNNGYNNGFNSPYGNYGNNSNGDFW